MVCGCTGTNSNSINSQNSQFNTNTSSNANIQSLDSVNTSNTIPLSMTPGSNINVTVTMKNTGTTPWSAANNISLGLADDSNNEAGLFSDNHTQYLIPPNVVTLPGYNCTWQFTIIAPVYPNNYTLMYRMLANNSTWFGDTLIVNVTNGNYQGPVAFVSVYIPLNMAH